MSAWRKVSCKKYELQIIPTLLGGQSFRWRETSPEIFTGVIGDAVWQLKQSDDYLFYKTFRAHQSNSDDGISLSKFFRLEENLQKLYNSWSEEDAYFKEAAKKFYAVRMLNQDLIENLFSFICSSNNNISRISSMVEKLCEMYGTYITELDGKKYYQFPSVENLCDSTVEQSLRKAGFGYRAKFIHRSAVKLKENGVSQWIKRINKMDYSESKCELMKLPGIGAKVADCICLMSLNHLEAIPVDTHVFQIACQRYLPELKGKKSVTDKIYNQIGDFFRSRFGTYAGWAHTILFCADLKMFNGEKKGKKRKQECE